MFCFMLPCRLVDGFEEMSLSTRISARPNFLRVHRKAAKDCKFSFIRFSVLKCEVVYQWADFFKSYFTNFYLNLSAVSKFG
jgi:hypothetical protein